MASDEAIPLAEAETLLQETQDEATPIDLLVTEGSDRGSYRTLIESILPRETITVISPIARGQPVSLHAGDAVTLARWRDDAGIAFDTTVICRALVGERDQLVLAYPRRARRLQRREYRRVPVASGQVEVTITFELDLSPNEAHVTDVSGGGLLVRCAPNDLLGQLAPQQPCNLVVEFETSRGHHRVQTRARLVRFPAPQAADPGFLLAIEFQELPPRDRDAIIRFVFDRERQILARDRGQ